MEDRPLGDSFVSNREKRSVVATLAVAAEKPFSCDAPDRPVAAIIRGKAL